MKSLLLATGLLAAVSLMGQPAAPKEPAPSGKTAPYATKAEHYAAAQKRLEVLKLQHGETHPLVVQQQALVAKLQLAARAEEKKSEQGAKTDDHATRLAKAKNELETLLQKYTEAHPQVAAQRRLIADLEKQR